MPSLPKVRKATRRIGRLEIHGQLKAESQRSPNGAGRIARKVTENLTGKGERTHPGGEARLQRGVGKVRVGDRRKDAICQNKV